MKKFVLFDFDGVIVDSFDLAFGINQRTIPALTVEEYRKNFEGNINKTMSKYNFRKGEKEFFKEYGFCLNLRKLTPGIKEIIRALSAKYSLLIVSSTTTEIIKKYLRCHNIEECFIDVLGNDVDYSKVHKFNMIFEKYDISAKDCIFITDTLGDIREADEVNLPTIAVAWGFHDEKTLEKGDALAILKNPEDLVEKVGICLSNI